MNPHLTVAYFTSRKQPMFEWFFDSLRRECGGNYDGIKIVIVDLWAQVMDDWTEDDVHRRAAFVADHCHCPLSQVVLTAPKPNVWNGRNRITKVNWFAASNARNTAVCHAPDGWIAFVDDLSVLRPGWLTAVRRAMAGSDRMVTCGSYRKVKELVVDDGLVKSFAENPVGMDNRFGHGSDSGPVACTGDWMYGCSLVAPVQAFLDTNGWPEFVDGMSFEDVLEGIALQKKGYMFLYDRTMMTFESEELHQQLPVMRRTDKGITPNDKSHGALRTVRGGDGWNANYFGPDGIAGLRKRILAGEIFPACGIPLHDWWDSQLIAEME